MHTATCAGSCGVSVPRVPAASPAQCLAQASHKAARSVQLQAWHPPFPKKQVFWVSPAPEAGHMPSLREKPLSPLLSHFSEQWHHGDPLKVGITHRDQCSRKHGPAWLRAPFPPPCKPWAIHEHLAGPCTLASARRLPETETGTEMEIAPGGNSPREGALGAVSANTWSSAPNTAAHPQGLNPCPGWKGGMWRDDNYPCPSPACTGFSSVGCIS